MASTLLAVDDSVTMRKVLEITFAGPDFRVVTANGPDAALQKLKAERFDLVITDTTLEPQNGYELCKSIKQISPTTPVIILSSKQNPFDPAKGSAAQADDHMDKPFDTQQMIDKVKKLLESRGAVAAARPAAAQPAPTAAATRPSAVVAPPMQASGGRAKTLAYTGAVPGGPAGPPPVAAKPPPPPPSSQGDQPPFAPTPVTGLPLQPRQAAPVASSGAAASHVNGQMASQLAELGLTPAQIEGVLALSREVVERVVWEVVPVLAETIIKEEIARLTK